MSQSKTKFVTGIGRASYAQVFKRAKPLEDGKEGKFQLTMIFDKVKDAAAIQQIREGVDAAIAETYPTGKIPGGFKRDFIKDGDTTDDSNLKGKVFIRLSSSEPVGVIDFDKRTITNSDPDTGFYSGCFCRASITIQTYEVKLSKGVTGYFSNVQKACNGEPMTGRRKAEDDFDAIDPSMYAYADAGQAAAPATTAAAANPFAATA